MICSSMSSLLVLLMCLQCVMMARMPSSSGNIHDKDDSAVQMVRSGVKTLLSDSRDKRRADKHLGVVPSAPSQRYSAQTTPAPHVDLHNKEHCQCES